VNQIRLLDDRLFLAVNGWARHTPALHGPVLAYARYGVVLIGALLLAALVVSRHTSSRDLAATGWAPVAMLLAVAINQPMGRLFGEARPYVARPGILRLADVTTDFSFPSDHAVMAGAVAAGLLLAHRRLGAVAVVAALLMAFSRVYIAAHYPWDVLAGLLLGAGVALLGWALLATPLTALTRWLRTLPGLRAVFADHTERSTPESTRQPVAASNS
jgi:membrane-associated phospholipid phosphatase